jgi:beta-N-acetylhexosaminidase
MATELTEYGIDFSFAPVLDVECGISKVIGDRAFGDDPKTVAALAGAFFAGMQDAGMAGVGKHFPGHGSVKADSHTACPIDPRTRPEIQSRDLIPFKRLIDQGLQGIMTAHVCYPACDSDVAGYSNFWIRDMLRGELGFDGAVFSDDLSMAGAGVAGELPSRALRALSAGCDMVLLCNVGERVETSLDAIANCSDPDRARRLNAMRARAQTPRGALCDNQQWHEAMTAITALNQRYADEHA